MASPAPAPLNWIYIRDVPESSSEDSLRKTFGVFGAVNSIEFAPGRGYQYLEFATADAASKAAGTAVRHRVGR
jgi:hypothetical protein